MDTLSDPSGLFPPLSPAGETRTADMNGLSERCIDTFRRVYPATKAKLGPPVITANAKWGLVFRADFRLSGEPASEFVNRLICWKKDNGVINTTFAIGQQVVALSEEKWLEDSAHTTGNTEIAPPSGERFEALTAALKHRPENALG